MLPILTHRPDRVISGHGAINLWCLLYPRKRTLIGSPIDVRLLRGTEIALCHYCSRWPEPQGSRVRIPSPPPAGRM